MRSLKPVLMLLLLLGAVQASPVASEEQYPTRPVKIIVPWPAGGVADFLARVVADRLSGALNQPVIVENKPGAGTNLGSEVVARAAPDGYTLLLASSNNAVNMTLYKDMRYDTVKDFLPISLLALVPNILVVNPKFPAHTVKELIDYSKAHPGKVKYASAGNGSPAHLAAEQFKRLAQVDMLNVPYKGAAPAVTDLIGGHVDVMFTNIPASLGSIQAGQLRAVAIGSTARSKSMPDLPTIAESGLPNYEAVAWYGLVAPAGTPGAIIEKLGEALDRTMKSPETLRRLTQQGTEPVISAPDALANQIRTDISSYRNLIHESGISIE
jgi:tripartite-type tricarboxylate transporter receptor subunit TctC